MNIHINEPAKKGHAHDVDLEDTFDFLNTEDTENGFPIERLPTLDDALTWFVDRGVIHIEGANRVRAHARANEPSGKHDIEHIHAVRSALREVAHSISEHRTPDAAALESVNRALHARQVIELVAAPDGCSVDHRHIGDPIDDALARLTEPLVTELTEGQPERIKTCASDTCDWIFYDGSRTSRRRWCDMATCGNRAKAARHRARLKGASASGAMPDPEAHPAHDEVGQTASA